MTNIDQDRSSPDPFVGPRTTDYLAPLQAITSALSRSLSPEEIAGVVISHALTSVQASAGAAFFCTPSGELQHFASRGLSPVVVEGWRQGTIAVPPVVRTAASTREVQWFETHEALVTAFPSVKNAHTPAARLQALVALPLKLGQRMLGVIGFTYSASKQWDDEEKDFLLTIAEVCAQALDRAFLYDAERTARAQAAEANRRLRLLSEASKTFAESNRDLESALSVIAQQLTEMVGGAATIALISLIREDGTLMENVAVRAQDPELSQQLVALARENPQRVGVGLRGRVAATGETVLLPVIEQDPLEPANDPTCRPLFDRFKPTTLMVVPLRAQDRILGTILLMRADPSRPYSTADLALVQELADRAALTIDNARLYEAAQRAIRVRDHILAIAAKELVTPLTVLRLQLSSLQASDQELRTASRIEKATRSLERLDNVIDQFSDISCISAGKLTLTPENVDLAALVSDVAGLFSERLARSACELDFHAAETIVGHWDKLRLEQVVTNLMSNACRHGRGRPIEVAVGSSGDMAFVQ
ncbi:MAG TPA: GAF domain-containing sensor histidine kinase, partial [Polyangia bacterium]|nr:GAF domain-containing sensor histidine kinase [Polyangia bacterium]